MKQRRYLRRETTAPLSAQREMESEYKYRNQISLINSRENTILKCRRSRIFPITGEKDACVWARDNYGWLTENEKKIGAIHLIEWHVDPFIDEDIFIDELDSHTQEAYDFGAVINAVWDIEEVSEYGVLLEFRFAWMLPDAARGSIWALAAEKLIAKYKRTKFALLVLKAFPLEYEGCAPGGSAIVEGLAFRRAAMQRHYARILGVRPLPGWPGEAGWMWRPQTSGLPIPQIRADDR